MSQHLEEPYRLVSRLAQNRPPKCTWLTGLSGAGKSSIASELSTLFVEHGISTFILDGDEIRRGLNADLGFSERDRQENIRRIGHVAALMVRAGVHVIVSAISPSRNDRNAARALFRAEQFIEVFVDTPIDICEQRDVKGLYSRARRGELENFTGITGRYEPPENPEFRIRCCDKPPAEIAKFLFDCIFEVERLGSQ